VPLGGRWVYIWWGVQAFWSKISDEFHWEKRWDTLNDVNFDNAKGPVSIKWFLGGKTNLAYNALDRHVLNGKGDTVAFYWEGNEPTESIKYTYAELLDKVKRFANVLKSKGVGKGDNVAIYLPMVAELPIAMLACARIGAVHSVVFGGFSAEALASRVIDSKAKVLVTADGTMRGKKLIDLLNIADTAMALVDKSGEHKVCMYMYIYVHVHVYMYVYLHVYMHIHRRTHTLTQFAHSNTCTHIHVHVHTHLHIHVHLHMRAPIHIHAHGVECCCGGAQTIYIYIYIFVRLQYICTFTKCTYTYTCRCIHIHLHECMAYTSVCMCMHLYVHIKISCIIHFSICIHLYA